MKIKAFFNRWAFLDIENTMDKGKTYFGQFGEEIGRKNLGLIRSLSIFFAVVCVFVIASTHTFFDAKNLRQLYAVILLVQVITFFLSSYFIKTGKNPGCYNWFSGFYLAIILGLGAWIGTVFSVEESAPVFLVILVMSQMLFILPPVVTTSLAALATTGTLVVSYFVKSTYYFESDVINCVGVFILSILLGGLVNKVRAEEAFARLHVLELNEKFQQMSRTDQLTGLPNHRSFQETYYELYESCRQGGLSMGVIMVDIDKFKPYNDHYGHLEGDNCLAAVGRAFKKQQTEDVLIFRFGGEEFLVLLKEPACAQALQIAEAMQKAVEELAISHAFSTAGQVVSISAGVHVGVPMHQETPTAFIDRADKAMYESKMAGGNRVTASQWE